MNDKEKAVRKTRQLTRRNLLLASAAFGGALAAPRIVSADAAYPSRPVRVLVPYSAGGGADTVSRILFAKLSEKWGQQFIIDNRGGGGGTIGATIGATVVAKADRDGYNILYDATAFSTNPWLYAKLPYDVAKDFEPVFLASLVTNFLLVNNSVEAKTVADVIAIAKAAPGGLDWASSGNGSVQHLCLEMFRHTAGVKLNHIPYRGGGPALNDLLAGQVKFFFSNASSSMGHVTGGSLKAIAHTGRGRLALLPDLPTVAETLPGFEAMSGTVSSCLPAPRRRSCRSSTAASTRCCESPASRSASRGSTSSSAKTRPKISARSWLRRSRSGARSSTRPTSSSGEHAAAVLVETAAQHSTF